jgi:deazaflavin-dependent oxidoreductase (nitroreductase family)
MSRFLFESAHARLARAGARLLRSTLLMRAPIWMYRARLGFMFGSRLLLLEHIGRRTGARRLVVLEVVGHPASDTYVVASGFGSRSQWYRNVTAHPRVRVSVAHRRAVPAEARVLEPSQAVTALQEYVDRHRRAWLALKPVLENTLGAQIGDDGAGLPLMELELSPSA